MCKYTYGTLWDNLKLSKFYCNVQDVESFECENASGKQTEDNRNTSKLKEFLEKSFFNTIISLKES